MQPKKLFYFFSPRKFLSFLMNLRLFIIFLTNNLLYRPIIHQITILKHVIVPPTRQTPRIYTSKIILKLNLILYQLKLLKIHAKILNFPQKIVFLNIINFRILQRNNIVIFANIRKKLQSPKRLPRLKLHHALILILLILTVLHINPSALNEINGAGNVRFSKLQSFPLRQLHAT